MNKVYRLVWNKATQTWNAVSEYAKSQGKSSNAVIMPSLKGAYRVMRTFMRFAYTALMSALLLLSGRAAIAVTGTTTSSGTSVTNAGSHNTCYYDTTTQSVVCGDASTKVPGVYGAGTSSAPSRISQSVVLGQGAEVADSFSRESSTDTIMHSHAVVIGQTAKANGYQSVAVGANSETSRRSTALGFGAKAGGHNKTTAAPDGELYGVAIGYKADAPRHHSVAIGAEAKVNAIATTDTARSNAILQSNPQNGLIDGATSASDSAGAMALGRGTKANGYAAIAHGLNAEATAAFSTAIGANSKADKMETIALGSRAEATEHHAISIGSSFKQDGATKASGENSIAIGTKAQSATNNTIAIGANSKVSGTTPIAAGSSVMSGISGIAIGSKSEVNNRNYGIAIGEDAFVGTYNETKKIGGLSYYNQDRGDQSDDAGRPGIAIGWKTQSTGDDSLALGNDSIATGRSSVAMGKAAYAEDTDAIAIGNSARAGQPASITPGSKVSNHNSTAIGSYAEAIGGWNTAIGTRSYVNASGSLAAGTMASAKGQRATAVGSFSFAEGETSTALGYHTIATETAKSGTAMGTGTVIDGKMSGAWSAAPHANPHQYDNTKRSIVGGEGNYAIGNENIVGNLTKNSVVFGNKIKIGADGATLTSTDSAGRGNSIKTRKEVATYTNATALENAVAIGNSSKVTVSNGVALGSNSVANVDKEEEGSDPLNAVTNKQNSTWKATHAAVSVGDGTDVTRQITSVAAGKNDTDAVNVAQLKVAGFELSVSETGGGISEDKTQPSNLSDKKVKNGETVTIDAGKNIKVTQTGKTVSIATKDKVDFTEITLGDATNNTVLTSTANGLDVGGDKITNVARGTADTDAVNVSQLKGAADALGGDAGVNTDGTFKAPSYTITKTNGTNYAPANNVGEALSNLNAEVIKPITFVGDSGANSTRKLGETLTIKGGANGTLTVGNIGVESDGNGTLTAKLAQNIDLGDNGSVQTGNTKLDKDGLTINNPADSTKNVSLTSGGLNNGGNKIANVANGAADTDAVNVSQLKDAQAAATSKVTAGDGITVTNTPNTDGSTTYKVAAATTPLTVTNGKVDTPAAADANKLATAGDIANAINNSGFNIDAGGNVTGNHTATLAKPGSTLTLKAGDGLSVKQEVDANGDQSYTYAVNAQTVVQDAQLPVVYAKADGTKVYKRPDGKFYDAPTGGNEVAAGDVIASMQNAAGSTTAPTTLANVKSNLADTSNATGNPSGNDRATLAAGNKGNNAATVNDVLNSGFTVQGNGTDKDFVTHGDTINFANGQGTVANVSTAGGVTTVKFDTPMTYVNNAGAPTSDPSSKVNLVGDAAGGPVTLGNVADGTIGAGSKEAINGGQLHDLKENGFKIAADNGTADTVKLTETVTYKGDNNIVTTVSDNQIGFKLADSITVGPATGGNPVKIDGNTGTVTGLTNKTWDPANITSGRGATEDQLKAAQAAATTKIAAGNGISVNGTQNADGSTTYKVAADTTPLTVADGKVNTPAAADANKLATAGDIANAINNSGFQATAGGNLASGSNATPTTVKPGQKVTFAAGNGLTVKQDIDNASGNQTYTYALDAQSVVQDAQLPVVYTKADGSKVYKQPDGKFYDAPTGGNEVPAGDVIASMQDAAGSTTAPTTLANVKSNLADAGNAVTNPAGNSRAELAGKGNNAATVNDVLNSGFTVQGNGQNKDFVTHGDTINFANGQGTVANVTSTNGVTTVKFDTPMTYADASGNPTSTPSNKVNLVGGDATKPVTLGNVADGTVAAGSKEAVNGGQLHATNQNVANNATNIAKGINFGGTTGSNNYQLGDTINVKGDSNITSTTVAGGAQLALNPNLNVTSVTTTDVAGNKTVTSGSGVTITPAAVGSNPVSLTTGGLNNGGNKITNVAAGTAGTDAVNVDQLKAAATKVTAGDGIAVTSTVDNTTGSTTYKVAAATTPLTVADGKVNTPATGDTNKLATAGDIANAINNSGFNIDADGNVTGNHTATLAKPGSTLTLKAGDGLSVKQEVDANGDQSYTYAVNAQSVVQDAQLPVVYTKADGSKVYKQPDGKFYDAPTGGNEVAAGDVISSMQDAAGSTTAPTTLANVKSNLADAGNTVTNPAGNSRADLAGKGNNAATVNDVLNSGFTVQGNGQNKDFVTHGDTIDFANGQGTVANVTSKNGVTTVKFDTPMTYADASGNPTSTPSNKVNLVGGDATKPVTLGNVADGTVAAGSKEAVNGGQLHATNQNVANNATNIAKGINFGGTTGSNNYQLGDTINVKGDSNITSTTVAGGAQLALNPNLNVTSVTTTDAAGNKTVTSGSGVTITPASGNPVSLTTGGLNNGGNKITNVKAGEDDTDAVNVSQLKTAQAAAKTTATAGKNITVKPTTNPDGSTNYEIATKDDVTFSKTTVGNVITDGATGKITGLTAGDVSATSTDAVNGSQLHAHGAGVKNIIGGNTTYNPATGNYTNVDIGGTGKGNIDAAIKAVKTEVVAGDNIAVASTVDADGKTTYTVATKKDLVVDSVKAGDKVTLNNAGLTASNVSVTTGGINAGNTIITNVQSGLNGKTLEQIKADPNATERNNAATIGDLATVQNNVTNINNNYNTVVNKVIGGTTPDGKVTDANGKIVKDNKGNAVNASDALKTYNVSGNHAKTDNTLITAIKNINEGGIKFFHVNDGTGNQNVTGSDTHAEDSAASGNFAAAVGYQAKASGANAIAFGRGAEATAENAISIGTGNKVSGKNSGAIGDPSIITGNNSYSVGNNNTVSTNNTFVLGNNVTQTVDNSVFLGNNAASTGVHTTANGGNYTYAGMNDAGVSGVSDVVGVVSVGKEGETRQIQNVAAGVVSATSTDAINGSQLYATAEGLAGTTINMGNQLNNRINEVKDDANAGVSSAMAMAALPQAYIPGKSMLTGGMATYNGQGAVAVGLSKLSDNGRWVLKVSGSADTKGNAGGAVGAGFHF